MSNNAFSVPKEFIHLSEKETVLVDLKYKGSYISSQIVNISLNEFQFTEPDAVLNDIQPFLISDIDSIKSKVRMGNKLLTKRYCLISPDECTPESDDLIFIYDPKTHHMDIHIKQDLLRNDRQYTYHEPIQHQERALIQSNAISVRSDFDGKDDFSLRTSSTLGLDNDTYLYLSGYITDGAESNNSSIESVYMRHALGNRLYFKVGKLSPYSQSDISEGLFNYNLIPQREISGVQLGTGMHYFNTGIKNDDGKIEIFSALGGRADIYQNNVFISSVNLYPGYNKIDTSSILGKFNREIDIKIYENGQLTRIDSHSLVSNSRLSDGLPQWMIKVGLDEDNDDVIEFATWYQTNKYINWLNDVSFSGQISSDSWFNEFGLSTSNSYMANSNLTLDWSNNLRFMLGNHNEDSINSLNLNSRLSTGKESLNIDYKKSHSERCTRNDISSCIEVYKLTLGSSIYGNSIRFSHEIRNKSIEAPFLYDSNFKRERSTLSLSRSLPIERLRAMLSSSVSRTHINNQFMENSFYINLSLSLRDTPSLYSVNSNYSDEGLGFGANYNYNDLNRELNLRAESNKGQKSRFSGSSKVEMYDKGKISTSFSVSESNHAAFLGYSLGLTLTESGVLSTGPASFSNNLSAIMLTTDNDKLPTHQIKTNSQTKDVRPSFNNLSYPIQGYNYLSYIINESSAFDDGKTDIIQRGKGRRDMLLTPGHLIVHEITSQSERYYLGQNHNLSSRAINSQLNNLTSLDIDDNGNYFIIANSDIDGFHVYIDSEAYFCKFSDIDSSNDIYSVSTTSCSKI
ncbi:TcfC E-set like domain-containing protein [Vibrio alginolyticus]|uniref:TcfC E-set like domain-containing protein n=1 Tax=Vibrio alginolyticus TaxID=663 RepID=UPI0015F487E8|nr:TcfC E-set like domain-containing protein [Vibrio alginolyticus]